VRSPTRFSDRRRGGAPPRWASAPAPLAQSDKFDIVIKRAAKSRPEPEAARQREHRHPERR